MFKQVFAQPARIFGHLCCHSYKNNNKESEIRRKLVLSIISRYKKFVSLAAPKWRQAMLESPIKKYNSKN